MNPDDKIDDILKKYGAKIEQEVTTEKAGVKASKNYERFRQEAAPMLNWYERACKRLGNFIALKPTEKQQQKLTKFIQDAHLDIIPKQVLGLSFSMFLLSFLFFIFIFIALFAFIGFNMQLLLVLFLGVIFSLVLFNYLNSLPQRFAQSWRLKASSQMVPAILYIVVYMRHTSNLERAILFASEHLPPPLSLDFKKIFWNVEVGKYSTIKQSLDAYLESWRDYALEFVEAFHLIESSLFEPEQSRRIEVLEKSLQVMLDGVYEKMLKYTHEVKAPLTNLYMLGIVLPTLGLALLPLASTLLQGMLKWYHVFILFNLMFPFFVFYLTQSILAKRPGGFGETELLERNPNYKYYKSKGPWIKAFIIAFPLFLLGLIPLLFQYTPLPSLLNMQKDIVFNSTMPMFNKAFDFKQVTSNGSVIGTSGPFGLIASLLSLLIPLSIALFFSIAYIGKTKLLIKTRQQTKKLEKEFASSLFQLGNRLGDGLPAEVALGAVAQTLHGTPTSEFFSVASTNIEQLGMSVDEALFNQKRGAVVFFPSELVKTSMRILIESVKKGLQVAARAMISISQYVKNIHKINERLRDLLADITSSMKSNMTFLAPLLSAIVVGLASMITSILNNLETMLQLGSISQSQMMGGFSANQLMSLFNVSLMIPPYFMQIIVGLYLIEIMFILTQTLVTISNGSDKLTEKYELAKSLRTGILLYTFAAFISIVALSLLAALSVGGIGGLG